jgi:hypothetical protein
MSNGRLLNMIIELLAKASGDHKLLCKDITIEAYPILEEFKKDAIDEHVVKMFGAKRDSV